MSFVQASYDDGMNANLTDPLCQTDLMDPDRARALQVTLGDEANLTAGDPLPPFFHLAYFWHPLGADDLGRDGHPARGVGVIPDLGLPRRMWAGGRVRFAAPILLGQVAVQTTSLLRAERKTGRSGPLGLVTLRLEIRQAENLCLVEERDLIFREESDASAAPPTRPRAPEETPGADVVTFSTTQLFRYSALTFNGHRIHYDRDYAQGVEGYPGLVVHGPLLAQLLAAKAARELGPLTGFEFRATAPLFDSDAAILCRDDRVLWVRGPDGAQCMKAEVTI